MAPTWYERMLLRLYRRALRGSPRHLQQLIAYGVHCLESGQRMPRGVERLTAQVLRHPAKYAAGIVQPRHGMRGRPGIDERKRWSPPSPDGKRFFGRLPTEKHALMIGYLLSQGYVIHEAPGRNRKSASATIADLVGRSTRQLQRDYSLHRHRLSKSPSQLTLGKALLDSKLRLAEIKKRQARQRPST